MLPGPERRRIVQLKAERVASSDGRTEDERYVASRVRQRLASRPEWTVMAEIVAPPIETGIVMVGSRTATGIGQDTRVRGMTEGGPSATCIPIAIAICTTRGVIMPGMRGALRTTIRGIITT
ncbi:MAG: hypothetical protein R3178_03335 [Rhodothermales bacterium]|nr:hypothetical protein [Rhodothermales bacterium]